MERETLTSYSSRPHPERGAVSRPDRNRRETIASSARKRDTETSQNPPLRTFAPAVLDDQETLADRVTSDRVHAWYRSHGAPSVDSSTASASQGKPPAISSEAAPPDAAKLLPVKTAASAPRKAAPQSLAATAKDEPQPDLSPVAPKATRDDFDRAVQKQAETVRQAAVVNQTRTSTADDDAAIAAESHIPSTAPTERVASPFVHGDLLSPATQTAAPRPSAVPVRPVVMTPGVAPKALVQSKPANPALKPLDPGVMDGMAAETFATSDSPATAAKAAVVLAAKTAKPDPITRTPVLPATAADADDDTAPAAMARVTLYDPVGRLQLLPPMKGTHEILVHQNQMAVADGLERIENDSQLLEMRHRRLLVALPDNGALAVDSRLPMNRRFARPWSVRFLNDLSAAHYARFGTPIIVTSAARTVAFQRRLVLTNGNAAPPTGDIASPHLYGQAVDIAKHGMSVTEIAWMRSYLTPVVNDGKIDVEEEFQQSCFHISIYRRYLGLPSRQPEPEPELPASRRLVPVKTAPQPSRHRRLPTALLATGLR